MILEIESARREERRKVIFLKMKQTYREYCGKYREIRRRFGEDKNSRALQDELKEKDDELVKVIEKCSILKGALRDKEEELEVSRGVEAQCGDLQAQVILLRAELKECEFKADDLSGEVAEKAADLKKVELAQSGAMRKMKALEIVICVICSERENTLEMARLKEEWLD